MKRMVDSELINSLDNNIKFDEMGNVTVGRNLEVGGNVFTLNGKQWGIMPVKSVNDSGVYSDMGFILSNILPHTNEDNTINVSGIWFNIANNYIKFCMSKSKKLTPGYSETHIEDGVLYISTHEIYKIEELFTTLLSSDYVSKTYQQKLYRHVINVGGGTAPDSYFGYIVYISTSSLKADSLQALTTLTKATSGFRYPLSGLCIQGGAAGRPTATNYNVLGYDGSIWHVGSGGTNLDSPTITSVSDTVTSL